MKQVVATALQVEKLFHSRVDVSHVAFEWGRLVVTLISGGDKLAATVTFTDVAGFRLLDEGDLLEFWPSCSQENGWIFQVHSNGWMDLESSRPGFLRAKGHGLLEYFVASQNGCVSILSSEAPIVSSYSI